MNVIALTPHRHDIIRLNKIVLKIHNDKHEIILKITFNNELNSDYFVSSISTYLIVFDSKSVNRDSNSPLT